MSYFIRFDTKSVQLNLNHETNLLNVHSADWTLEYLDSSISKLPNRLPNLFLETLK